MDIEDDYDDDEDDWEDDDDDEDDHNDEDDKDDDDENDWEDEEDDDDEDKDDDDYERFRDYYDDRYFKIYGRPRVRRSHHGALSNINIAQHEQASSTPRPSVPSTNSTCGVCWDQVAVNDFVQGKVMPGCQHETNVCRSCLAQSITAQLESKLWNQLTCPLCTVRIDGNVVERFATSHTISR